MYYRFGDDCSLEEECLKSSYISLTNYKATIQAPKFENGLLHITDVLLARIKDSSKYPVSNMRIDTVY